MGVLVAATGTCIDTISASVDAVRSVVAPPYADHTLAMIDKTILMPTRCSDGAENMVGMRAFDGDSNGEQRMTALREAEHHDLPKPRWPKRG